MEVISVTGSVWFHEYDDGTLEHAVWRAHDLQTESRLSKLRVALGIYGYAIYNQVLQGPVVGKAKRVRTPTEIGFPGCEGGPHGPHLVIGRRRGDSSHNAHRSCESRSPRRKGGSRTDHGRCKTLNGMLAVAVGVRAPVLVGAPVGRRMRALHTAGL